MLESPEVLNREALFQNRVILAANRNQWPESFM